MPNANDRTVAHNALCKAIGDYVGYMGGYLVKNWGGPIGAKGRPDLEGCFSDQSGRGRFLSIEVKTGTGELSADQREHKRRIERAGGIFIEARSVDDVQERLLAEGLVKTRTLF
jgi:hypothetical protein